MSTRFVINLARIATVAAFCISHAFAQGVYGSIQGTVHDAGGALVPDAAVSVREVSTGLAATVHTNHEGLFVLTSLRPGVYNLTAHHEGFSDVVRPRIEVRVGEQVSLELGLSVGPTSTSVSVTGEAPLVHTDDTLVGSVIDERTIKQLPLSGRNAFDLALLTPGVTISAVSNGTGADTQPRLSGGRSRTGEFTLDGTSVTDPRRGDTVISPNLDAIQEFAIITNGIQAQYGRLVGGIITATTKSGTNKFHGNVFEFHRGDGFGVARNYFATGVPHQVYNQFGGIIGGPIRRDKLFFFVDYQGTRNRQQSIFSLTVPTAKQQSGDFSDILGAQIATDVLGRPVFQNQIFDPATTRIVNGVTVRDPFPGNVIPTTRWDAASAKVAALYVQPNRGGLSQNFATQQSSGLNQDQGDVRVDWQIGPRDLAFLRFSTSQPQTLVARPFATSSNGGNLGQRSTFYTVAIAETHTFSSSLVNDFRFGGLRGELLRLNVVRSSDSLNIPNVNQTALPTFAISGYDGIGDSIAFDPTQESYQLADNVTLVKGKHIISLGEDFRRFRINDLQLNATTFNFSALQTGNSTQSTTGNSYASFLLGATSQYSIDPNRGRFYMRSNYFAGYAQDVYKMTNSFTANIGMRYEVEQNPNEKEYNGSQFDINTGTIQTMRQLGTNRIQATRWTNFGPRIGFAWQPFKDSTVVRASFGIFYSPLTGRATSAFDRFPKSRQYTLTSSNVNAATIVSQTPPVPNDTIGFNLTHQYSLPNAKVPSFQQFDFDIQRQFPFRTLVQVGYSGSNGRHLMRNVQYNQLTIGQVQAQGKAGTQAQRPFPNYANVGTFCECQSSSYNALLVSVERRYANGFMVRGAFTWSKLIDEQNDNFSGLFPQDEFNPAAERGLSLSNIPTRLVVSSLYELPFGNKRHFLRTGPLAALVTGWEVGGIFSVQSGQQTWIRSANITSGTFSQMQRPNIVADPNIPVGQRTLNRYFNTAAFSAAAPLTFGNSSKTPNIQGPVWYNVDANLHRDIPLHFTETTRLELRGECFNCLNHANFLPPSGLFGSTTFGQINTAQPARTLQVAGKLWF